MVWKSYGIGMRLMNTLKFNELFKHVISFSNDSTNSAAVDRVNVCRMENIGKFCAIF